MQSSFYKIGRGEFTFENNEDHDTTAIDEYELKALVEANSYTTARKLVGEINVSIRRISEHLNRIENSNFERLMAQTFNKKSEKSLS